ncbi:MAG: nucleotide-diphospho-sugar transferase [Akkermansiaceae bacterium]|nr:nucleotide-diphospho-sugar transferase [Akkermansiaceae bacterium]
MPGEPVNIVCMKWGTRYPSHYVNILYRSLGKHLSRPFRFLCITDDTTGLVDGVETMPFPPNPGITQAKWPNVFMKLVITEDGFANLVGPTLFLDLDLVVLDSIDSFFDYKPGKNIIIHNWIERRKQIFRKRPEIGNSSIFRFEAGKSQYIYDTFINQIHEADDRTKFRTEQVFLTYAMKERYWWPEEWVRSFKYHCRPAFPLNLILAPQKPRGAKFLVFHGQPDPHDAIDGARGKKLHHRFLPAPWVADFWHE